MKLGLLLRLGALAAAIGLGLFLLLWTLWPVHAADPSERRDPIRGQWFKGLRTPPGPNGEPSYSCCDVSDCQRVESTQIDGAWWFQFNGQVVPVPDDRIVRSPATIDGEAYACLMATPGIRGSIVRCFIPPSPGY